MKLSYGNALIVASLLTATLGGCAHSASKVPLARSVPATCERLAERVPLPSISKGDDMRAVAAKHRRALVLANRRLDSSRGCQAGVRRDYSRD